MPSGYISGFSNAEIATFMSFTSCTTVFNRLPQNLKDFYEQMESNEFSTLGDVYSKCVSTKSAYTKRKRVFQFTNFPGGIDKCFAEFGMKSAIGFMITRLEIAETIDS